MKLSDIPGIRRWDRHSPSHPNGAILFYEGDAMAHGVYRVTLQSTNYGPSFELVLVGGRRRRVRPVKSSDPSRHPNDARDLLRACIAGMVAQQKALAVALKKTPSVKRADEIRLMMLEASLNLRAYYLALGIIRGRRPWVTEGAHGGGGVPNIACFLADTVASVLSQYCSGYSSHKIMNSAESVHAWVAFGVRVSGKLK